MEIRKYVFFESEHSSRKVIRLYYKEYGAENFKMIVFIHGGAVSGWMWDKQIDYFSKKFHCLVPDLPEHGKSRKEDDFFSINAAADKIIQLIEEKGEGKTVAAAGFSLGSQVLLSMIAKRKDLIQHAMINSALVKPIPFANTLNKTMIMALPLVKNKTFAKAQAKTLDIGEEHFDLYYQETLQINKGAFLRVMKENSSFTTPSSFYTYPHNLLVTVGEKEKKIMKDSMLEIAAGKQNVQAIIFPGVGHSAPLSDHNRFNRLLEEWIIHNKIIDDVRKVTKI